MDARGNLVELLQVDLSGSDGYEPELIADYLIANGVTVQEWIPVTERLPEEDGDYLVFKRFAGNAWSDVVSFAKDGRQVSECTFVEKWQNVWYYYDSEWGYIRTDAVTHWMPLPEPPEKAINQDHNKGKENDYGNQSE